MARLRYRIVMGQGHCSVLVTAGDTCPFVETSPQTRTGLSMARSSPNVSRWTARRHGLSAGVMGDLVEHTLFRINQHSREDSGGGPKASNAGRRRLHMAHYITPASRGRAAREFHLVGTEILLVH